jgi:hypothetical protein
MAVRYVTTRMCHTVLQGESGFADTVQHDKAGQTCWPDLIHDFCTNPALSVYQGMWTVDWTMYMTWPYHHGGLVV